MMRLKWKLGLICLEIVLILMQDRCMICKKHTICLEINFTHPLELLDDVCHMEFLLRSVCRHCKFICKIGAQFAPNAA